MQPNNRISCMGLCSNVRKFSVKLINLVTAAKVHPIIEWSFAILTRIETQRLCRCVGEAREAWPVSAASSKQQQGNSLTSHGNRLRKAVNVQQNRLIPGLNYSTDTFSVCSIDTKCPWFVAMVSQVFCSNTSRRGARKFHANAVSFFCLRSLPFYSNFFLSS